MSLRKSLYGRRCITLVRPGNFNPVTVDKDCFRLRQNTRKRVTLTIIPSPNNQSPLNIERSVMYNVNSRQRQQVKTTSVYVSFTHSISTTFPNFFPIVCTPCTSTALRMHASHMSYHMTYAAVPMAMHA